MKFFYTYSKKWLFYIAAIMLLFISVLLVSEYRHERKFRTQVLNDELDNYTVVINNYLGRYNMISSRDFSPLDSINMLISKRSLRTTLRENTSKSRCSKAGSFIIMMAVTTCLSLH